MFDKETKPHFHSLTPEVVVRCVEESLDVRCTSLCRPYKSYINRVYELQQTNGESIVAKFYRPGRWSREALQDEHDFLFELAGAEIPVIAPLRLCQGESIGTYEDTFFTVFPKKGGRNCDEFTDDQWCEIGHLLARMHAVGAQTMPKDRIILTPDKATADHVRFIVEGDFIPHDLRNQYYDMTHKLIDTVLPLFEGVPLLRIHGDCHFANIIHRPAESFFLIDFDDMVVGPAVQDVWMLLPGYVQDCLREWQAFLEGYNTFYHFEPTHVRLIEPLRAMRYIHFSAWCAHQVADGGFAQVVPEWGTKTYWQTEINDLRQQIERIRTSYQR